MSVSPDETKDVLPDVQGPPKFLLKLYVAGTSPMSQRAVDRAKRFCETYLPGAYELRVIDVYQQPELAEEAQILALPTLVKRLPPPLRQLIGDLSDTNRLLIALDINLPDSEPSAA